MPNEFERVNYKIVKELNIIREHCDKLLKLAKKMSIFLSKVQDFSNYEPVPETLLLLNSIVDECEEDWSYEKESKSTGKFDLDSVEKYDWDEFKNSLSSRFLSKKQEEENESETRKEQEQ